MRKSFIFIVLVVISTIMVGCIGYDEPQFSPSISSSSFFVNPVFEGDSLIGAQDTLDMTYDSEDDIYNFDTVYVGDTVLFATTFYTYNSNLVTVELSWEKDFLNLWYLLTDDTKKALPARYDNWQIRCCLELYKLAGNENIKSYKESGYDISSYEAEKAQLEIKLAKYEEALKVYEYVINKKAIEKAKNKIDKLFVIGENAKFIAEESINQGYDKENVSYFTDANAIILDTQYTVEEALYKANWGHSAFSLAVDFATKWNIKKMYLFHHEPTYDDKKLNSILQSAQWYAQYVANTDMELYLAQEGLSFSI